MTVDPSLAERLFPGLPVAVAWVDGCRLGAAVSPPFAVEFAAVAAAAPVRQRAFALGRIAAHAALAAVGAAPAPLLAGSDRAPSWPAGFAGSLAHTDDVAVAVAGRDDGELALGIDVERARELEPDLWPTITTARERAWLAVPAALRPGRRALDVFCAKEAVYKAWSRRGRRILEFHEVELEWDAAGALRAARVLGAPVMSLRLESTVVGPFVVASARPAA
ncbi:MAG: 4'-phosphopantetheinyl transferase superfamily protein [Planctomycetota bacterium]